MDSLDKLLHILAPDVEMPQDPTSRELVYRVKNGCDHLPHQVQL